MEEILASIRRIISEDGEEAAPQQAQAAPNGAAADTAQAAPEPMETPLQAEPEQASAEVLELTQVVSDEPPAPEPVAQAAPQPQPEPEPVQAYQPEPVPQPRAPEAVYPMPQPEPEAPEPVAPAAAHDDSSDDLMIVDNDEDDTPYDDGIIGDQALSAASAAFGSLGRDVAISEGGDSRSLEAIVQDTMRPMLKDWLDDNLPEIVEEVVEREVRRISRNRRR